MSSALHVACGYCGKPAQLVTGREIYPHRSDLARKKLWSCKPCGAYVGCHDGTIKPLGRLADAELRAAKMEAHAALDPLWRGGGMSRFAAYHWLHRTLGIPMNETHIGLFTVEQCKATVEAVKSRSAS